MTPDINPPDPTSAESFEAKYRTDLDPWNFATSTYERGRYAQTVSALTRPRYGSVYEPGYSVGELTAMLAQRCDRVIAADISETAVQRARERCRLLPNVSISHAASPNEVPTVDLDLVVFSEIGYYFTLSALRAFAQALAEKLIPGGEFIAVHWLGKSHDHVLQGDEVHAELLSSLALRWVAGHRYDGFRIDTWVQG